MLMRLIDRVGQGHGGLPTLLDLREVQQYSCTTSQAIPCMP